MKKLLAVFLALMMILSVSLMACSDKNEKEPNDDEVEDDDFVPNKNKDTTGTTDANEDDKDSEGTKAPASNVWTNETGTIYVRADGVAIRAAARTNSTKVGTANRSDSFTYEAYTDDWYKIKVEGNVAYISAAYVTGNQNDVIFEAPTKVAANSAIHVKSDATIFLRKAPAVHEQTVAGSIDSTKTANGELIVVSVSKSGSWAEVRFTGTDLEKNTYDGIDALYCHTSYIVELSNVGGSSNNYG